MKSDDAASQIGTKQLRVGGVTQSVSKRARSAYVAAGVGTTPSVAVDRHTDAGVSRRTEAKAWAIAFV